MGKSLLLFRRRLWYLPKKVLPTYLPLKNTSLLKVVQPPPSILHGTLEKQARNSIFSIFDPFFIFRLPDKSFVVDWIDDVVNEYRVQLDLELAFCILLYSSHSLLYL